MPGSRAVNATGVLMSHPRTHAESSGMPTTYSQGTILFTSALVSFGLSLVLWAPPTTHPAPLWCSPKAFSSRQRSTDPANHEGEGHHYERGKKSQGPLERISEVRLLVVLQA